MNNLLSIFDRMNAGQAALAILFLCAIGAIVIVGLESLRTSIKNYYIRRSIVKKPKLQNTFKKDAELEDVKDAAKSFTLLAVLVIVGSFVLGILLR